MHSAGGPASDTVLLCQYGHHTRMMSSSISLLILTVVWKFNWLWFVQKFCPACHNRNFALFGEGCTWSWRCPCENGGRLYRRRAYSTDWFSINMNGFKSIDTFYVIDLDGRWDLILSIGWLAKHNPLIDWRSNPCNLRRPERRSMFPHGCGE